MDVTDPDWLTTGWNHVWLPYAQMRTAPLPMPVVRTSGSEIQLADGRILIDGIASWWTACHGYNHPHIRAAVAAQLEAMPHVMFGGLAHEPAYRLAARLAGLLPDGLNRVFFTDSGSVAVEVAMKIAVQARLNRGARDRTKFVAFHGGYHGDTFATMAICDPEEGMHALFAGMLAEQVIAPLPRDAASRAAFNLIVEAHAGTLAGIIVEPLVQGAGGMVFNDAATLRHLRATADHYGLTLIFDEIFTGFGRTGTMFAWQQAGVVPDIITLSKALTGGTSPLAATIVADALFEAFLSDNPGHALMHGPTFMANPLGCAAANASLDLFETEPRLAQAAAIEAALRTGLAPCRALPGVVDVRVMGAIGVVQLERIDDPAALRAAFIRHGVWVRPFRDIVYLTPALTIDPGQLSDLCQAVVNVVNSTTAIKTGTAPNS
ncbi:MAG: adenosylmethionine--8-amino-7-oxononanoate transaminase [Acidiphilium sp. 37-64-53]|uniref:adenosylmethionine--8-amino-7-oxononanoate transaminase n=1 Tax=Acidiphilium TaxID=522 RepID=UPI000BD553E0|nr:MULTISPECIES: adenosylmethionine--8-amino-7-oxononanoate transaminase [Acidiphilium]OYW00515.1 MAG: adenosylmethionine--8-amino-7-oxononanoate transaminase [Acidiphilium sp. 37-64-53]OZB23137.1 MAG: adenosylmethionine--8-amino-7-oxononanoate transaminase [Acidiphilium sp. 34-64-41]HQT86163.1 adenosylmethionine--8-amino-7-oxononanoate transaminase [Acidiphilium rubrum]